jgi:hypothetical protein
MAGDTSRSFDPRIIGALVLAGFIGFIGYWLLTAFSPELSTGRNGGTHALSRSAVSFSAITEIAKAAGRDVTVGRGRGEDAPGLVIFTPDMRSTPEQIAHALDLYPDADILIVPNKWLTGPVELRPGWVRALPLGRTNSGMFPLPGFDDRDLGLARPRERLLTATVYGTPVSLPVPRGATQILRNYDATALIAAGDGALLARVDFPLVDRGARTVHILADPDILNNHGIDDPARATAALALLDALGARCGLVFDVTLNGLGASDRSFLRLALTPPFLGLTLGLLIAAMLALWQGFVRFGPPLAADRAVALGKAALVDNGAELIVQARRAPQFAARYAAMVREAAARRLHAPSGLAGAGLDRWLDRFADRRGRRFSDLVSALESARSPSDTLAGARALGEWRKDILRDSE